MYYFIANPLSGNKEDRIWSMIRDSLQKEQVPFRLLETTHPGHAGEYAAEISSGDGDATIVLLGGDGSVHEVLSGLTRFSGITFGLIPKGSGNDFARGMGISRDPMKALQSVLHPVSFTDLDIPYILTDGQRQRFGVSAGIGFDAAVCHGVNDSELKAQLNRLHLGRFSYTVVSAQAIAAYKPGRMRIRVDQGPVQTFEKTYFAAVMNQRFEGGGYMMTPDALPDDGALNVLVCSSIPKPGLLAALPLAAFGKHTGIPGLHFLKGQKIDILADCPRPVHLDGETAGVRRSISCALEKETLRVITD